MRNRKSSKSFSHIGKKWNRNLNFERPRRSTTGSDGSCGRWNAVRGMDAAQL